MEVSPLAADFLMVSSKQSCSFPPSLAVSLARGGTPMGFLELLLGSAVVARILDPLAIRGDKKHPQPHINTSLAARGRQWPRGHLGTGERHIPALGFVADGDRFGRA